MTVCAESMIENVQVRQLWPWSGDVDIAFTVTGTKSTAVKFTAQYEGVEPYVIPERELSGDFFDAAPGQRHVRWNPKRAGLDSKTLFNLKITAEPDDTDRTYLILNLYDGSYRYAAAEPEGGWLADPANYQTNIVFRRIPKGTKTLGLPDGLRNLVGLTAAYSKLHKATLSSDYYISVYMITEGQDEYAEARGNGEVSTTYAKTKKPFRAVYNEFRGSKVTDGIDWPNTRYAVSPDSRIADYRTITQKTFPEEWIVDLPTVAQWEYAARATTDDNYLWSVGGTEHDSLETITNLIDEIAVWSNNVNKDGLNSTDIGQRKPNDWGLYDMIGLHFEWNLDWYKSATSYYSGIDPVGPSSGEARVRRSAYTSKMNGLNHLTTAVLGSRKPDDTTYDKYGYRLCIHLKSLFKK